jgi:hypothetical protein
MSTTSIGTLIRMREWADRIRNERELDKYYSQPTVKLRLLEEQLGKDFLRDWPTLTDSTQ